MKTMLIYIKKVKVNNMKKVNVSFDVFDYKDLSTEAKEKVKKNLEEHITDFRFEDFKDYLSYEVAESFALKVNQFSYSLGYSQGDGLSFSCDNFLVPSVISLALEYLKNNLEGLKIFNDFMKLSFVVSTSCNPGRYSYAHNNQVNINPRNEEAENFYLLHETFLLDVFGYVYVNKIAKRIEDVGYQCYTVTEEDIIQHIETYDMHFLEDGSIFQYE